MRKKGQNNYMRLTLKTKWKGKLKLGVWYINERNNSHTTARGDCMQGMKAIVSILYNHNHLRKLGSDEKVRVKKMISELKSIARTGEINEK